VIHVSSKILCLDDQQEILELLRRQLTADYDCVFASGGEEALALLQAEGPCAAVVVDYDMPGMNGVEFLQEMRTRSPDTAAVMLTAHHELDIAIKALHEGNIFRFMRKPWEPAALKRCLDDAIEHYRVVVTERMLARALTEANKNLQKKLDQLQEANRLMEYWVEFSPAVIYCFKLANGVRKPSYVSRNFPRLTGYERTELIADPKFWLQHVHPADRETMNAAIDEALSDLDDQHALEYRFKHADGSYRRIYDSFRVLRAPSGEALEMVGAWMDLTGKT
jgi:PAS domain S-box-containing protein